MKKKTGKGTKVKAIPKRLAVVKTTSEPMLTLKDVLKPDEIKKYKDYLCPGATDIEIGLLLNVAKLYKLNPFKREIYLIVYNGKDGRQTSVQVGYEVYLKRASRIPAYAGFKVWTEPKGAKIPVRACVWVFRKDWGAPLEHEVDFDEYVKTRWDKEARRLVPTRFWQKMPKTMLKKVAISQAFRLAFPDELGGMPYIKEEIDADLKDMTGEATVTSGKPDVKMPTLIEKDVDTKKPSKKPEVIKMAKCHKCNKESTGVDSQGMVCDDHEPIKEAEVVKTNVKPDDNGFVKEGDGSAEPPKPEYPVSNEKKANEGQLKYIKKRLNAKGISEANICKDFKLNKIEELPASGVNAVLQVIEEIEG